MRLRLPWRVPEAPSDMLVASGESLLRQLAYGMNASGIPQTSPYRAAKERNFALERDLDEAEELAAWCLAVRAPASSTRALRDDLRTAWTIVLRNQRDNVAAGSAPAAPYAEMNAEYDRAERIVARVRESARAILPRAMASGEALAPCAPQRASDGTFTFENGIVRAIARPDGTLIELAAEGGPNLVALANGLAGSVDGRRVRVRPNGAIVEDDALVVRFAIGKRSSATLRLALYAGEPYLRADLAVAWHEDRASLRLEHRFAVNAQNVRFGTPHGACTRTLVPRTPEERAMSEIPAQRWVHVDVGGRGCALFAPTVYGWSAHALRGGGVRVGMSLLDAPRRPDPAAERGEHQFSYAFVPTAGAPISALEGAFGEYALAPRVRLFTCDDPSVMVVATKPADDGDGIIVRVRECDGEPRDVALRCGGRMRAVLPVDACEQTIAGDVSLDGETLRFMLPPFALRAFRIQL
jgi:alpha-mannosidase